jgi:hypothetical protein
MAASTVFVSRSQSVNLMIANDEKMSLFLRIIVNSCYDALF